MRARKARSVILAPDIKQYEDVGDFDGVLVKLLRRAALGNIPVIYALSRKQIGQVSRRPPCRFPVGLVRQLGLGLSLCRASGLEAATPT